MKRPVVGLTVSRSEERDAFESRSAYAESLQRAGAHVILFPWDEPSEVRALLGLCDGLVLSGGVDLEARRWGASPEEAQRCETPQPGRDAWELALFQEAESLGLPILGICRGFQLMNLARGGDFYADLEQDFSREIDHGPFSYDEVEEPRSCFMHEVALMEDPDAGELWLRFLPEGQSRFAVNSYHHQGIRKLGEGLVPLLQAPDGLVEAVADPEMPWFLGVQWHPEFLSEEDPTSRAIFASFVAAC